MFEILIGRTPFEANEEEQFSTNEELRVYYERTKAGKWVGEWSMSSRKFSKHHLRLIRSNGAPSQGYDLA